MVLFSIIPVQYQDGYQNTIIDIEESKKVDNVWDDNICSKKLDSTIYFLQQETRLHNLFYSSFDFRLLRETFF